MVERLGRIHYLFSYSISQKILEDFAHGVTEVTVKAFEAAKASLIFSTVQEEETASEAALASFYEQVFYFFIFLFYFILFHFISFYFISFHFISFYFILFYFILFYFILFYFILFYFILLIF